MKITIVFNKEFETYFNNKENLKKLVDKEDFNARLKTAIDNEQGLNVKNPFGQWVYKIKVTKDKSE